MSIDLSYFEFLYISISFEYKENKFFSEQRFSRSLERPCIKVEAGLKGRRPNEPGCYRQLFLIPHLIPNIENNLEKKPSQQGFYQPI